VLIEITLADIENGRDNACTLCPLALALHRLTGVRWFVSPDDVVPLVAVGAPDFPHILLPAAARDWIDRYDGGHRMEPISFELAL
jgi:hypothetical protein